MKKARHNTLRTSFLSAAMACAMAISAFAADSGVITEEVVNARKGPGTGYEVIEMLAKGKTVTVLGEESGWYRIQWNDSTGYVRNDYLAVNGKAPAKTPNATVTGGSVINVRSGPGTGYSRVTMVAEGKRVAILGKDGDWYHVSFDGTAGYILSDYVAADGSGTSSKSAGTPAKPKPVDTSVGNATVSGGDVINVRSGPDTSYSRLARVGEGKRVTLLAEEGGWFKVSFDSTTGYILGDYLKPDDGVLAALVAAESAAKPEPKSDPTPEPAPEPAPEPDAPAVEAMAPASSTEASSAESGSGEARSADITGGTINVRTGPGTEFERVTLVSTGKKINVLGEENGWLKVSFGDTTGYVLGDYVTDEEPPAAGVGVQVSSLAAQYLGVRYVYGGASPSGFDCSGFTMWLYKQYGYSLPHTASGQYANCGRKVSRSELQPGDLVFFCSPGSGGRINHAALYVGGGDIIHARYSLGKVYRNSLSENYYSTYYVGAVRIV